MFPWEYGRKGIERYAQTAYRYRKNERFWTPAFAGESGMREFLQSEARQAALMEYALVFPRIAVAGEV